MKTMKKSLVHKKPVATFKIKLWFAKRPGEKMVGFPLDAVIIDNNAVLNIKMSREIMGNWGNVEQNFFLTVTLQVWEMDNIFLLDTDKNLDYEKILEEMQVMALSSKNLLESAGSTLYLDYKKMRIE